MTTIKTTQDTTVQMTGDNGASASLMVNISNGALEFPMPLANQKIATIVESMKELMSLGADVEAVVNGKKVDSDYVAQGGDQVELTKAASEKGC